MLRVARWVASTLGSLLVVYAFFTVPVGGNRTLWEHVRRIAATPEARDLGRDLGRAGRDAADRFAREALPPLHPDHGQGHADDSNTGEGVIQPDRPRPGTAPGAHPPR